jgi:hypothetical protein
MVHSSRKQREIKGIIKSISTVIGADMDAAPLVSVAIHYNARVWSGVITQSSLEDI